MKYVHQHGYDFSRLTLGTVQLGMNYGISNVHGKPSSANASEIIAAALKEGITTLDTSITYGSAEEEIGRYLTNNRAVLNPIVVTKFKISVNSSYDEATVRDEIYRSVESSLRRLALSTIPVYLFHKDKNQNLEELVEPVSLVMRELQEKRMVDIAGVSAYGPEDVDFVLNHDIFAAVQIPINIFDQRLIRNGKLKQLKDRNKIVFARSIFLQGLFFMSLDEIPERLQPAKKYLKKLEEVAKAANLTVPQLSFSFVNNLEAVTSIVFGALSTEQVYQNIEMLKTPSLDSSLAQLAGELFAEVPELIITPGLW